jgi:hypothetical protein
MQEERQRYIDALKKQQEEEEEARRRYLQQRQAALEEYRKRQEEEEQRRVQAMEEARKEQEQRRCQMEEERAHQHRLERLSHIRQNIAARTIQHFMRTAILLGRIKAIARRFEELKEAFVFPASVDLQDEAAAEPKLAYTQNNYAIHAFDDALSKLLVQLDGIESHGILEVRERRKQVVNMVEKEAQALEERWKAAAKVQQQGPEMEDENGVEPAPSCVESAEDVEDNRMSTDEDDGLVVSSKTKQSLVDSSTETPSTGPDVVPETTAGESSSAADEPTSEHIGEPTSTPTNHEVDPNEFSSTTIESTSSSFISSSSLPTHANDPLIPTDPFAIPTPSASTVPELGADVSNSSGDALTPFEHAESSSSLTSASLSSSSSFTNTAPVPDPSSSSSSSSRSPRTDTGLADEDNEDEEIEEVDRALTLPLGAESTEGEGEETWEDAWEELMPLDLGEEGDVTKTVDTTPSSVLPLRQSPNEEASILSEKLREQTTLPLPQSPDDGEEDFEMV